mmetsp:Transcript_26630/g.56266  ORF Transcript_26630/g.56266 Transcript_26630/m.56266 type:complete len:142 (+) Transcript_26630:1210-1635(+)
MYLHWTTIHGNIKLSSVLHQTQDMVLARLLTLTKTALFLGLRRKHTFLHEMEAPGATKANFCSLEEQLMIGNSLVGMWPSMDKISLWHLGIEWQHSPQSRAPLICRGDCMFVLMQEAENERSCARLICSFFFFHLMGKTSF